MIAIHKWKSSALKQCAAALLSTLCFIQTPASAQQLGKQSKGSQNSPFAMPNKGSQNSQQSSPQSQDKSQSQDKQQSSQPASSLVIKEVPQIPDTGLVAKVGKGGLTKSEYDFYLLRFANKAKKNVKALSSEERKIALNEGIDDELLFQAALEDGALNDSYIRFMMSSMFRSNQTAGNIRPDQFTDAQLKAYYDAHPGEFCSPSENTVKGAKFNSAAGAADFIKKVKKLKDPASAPDWNDLGCFTEGKTAAGLPAEICAKVVKLKKRPDIRACQ